MKKTLIVCLVLGTSCKKPGPSSPLGLSQAAPQAVRLAMASKASKSVGTAESVRRPAPAALLEVSKLRERAPDNYEIRFETSKGDFVVAVSRAWAPEGADRLFNLVEALYFDGMRFFRAVKGSVVQFGVHGHPAVSSLWSKARILDDPRQQPNRRGSLSFVTFGPMTRTSRLQITLVDSPRLDEWDVVPVGRVISGIETVEELRVGEVDPRRSGDQQPNLARILIEGDAYLEREYPDGDLIRSARIVR
jgi:cyclophilin family peptidyl-prolyl cis-trans isomerase